MSSDEKKQNVQVKRPLSPHLSVYRPQITSMLSISHRLTGVLMFVGALAFIWLVILSVYGCASCLDVLIYNQVAKGVFIVWTLVLYFHMLNGVRHLVWDVGYGFSLKALTASGVTVLVAAVVLTIITWFGDVLLQIIRSGGAL